MASVTFIAAKQVGSVEWLYEQLQDKGKLRYRLIVSFETGIC